MSWIRDRLGLKDSQSKNEEDKYGIRAKLGLTNKNTPSNFASRNQNMDNLSSQRNLAAEKLQASREKYQKYINEETKEARSKTVSPLSSKPTYDLTARRNEMEQLAIQNAQAQEKATSTEKAKELKQDIKEKQSEYNYANYLKNQAEVENTNYNFGQKVLNPIVSGAADLLQVDRLDPESQYYFDEEGNKTYLPTKRSLKQQKIREESKGALGVYNDVAYNMSKAVSSKLLDMVSFGGGTALYYGDIMLDSTEEAKKQGFNNKEALAYGAGVTVMARVLDDFIGTFGGLSNAKKDIPTLSQGLDKLFVKLTTNKTASTILSNMTSEALSEYYEEFADNALKYIINSDQSGYDSFINMLGETLPDALYSGLVGGISGGVGGTIENITNASEIRERKQALEDYKATLENYKPQTIEEANYKNDELDKVDNALEEIEQQEETVQEKNQDVKEEIRRTDISEEKTLEQKTKEKEELKTKLKVKAKELNDFVEKNKIDNGGLTEENANKYKKKHKELSDIEYKLETEYFKEITEKNIKDDRQTGFDKEVYVQARKDDLANKNIYDALTDAAAGVNINADTKVDDILNGKNKKVSPQELYDAFKNTREKLREKYGDKVTLYRVETRQKQKATKNYGSSIEYTKSYGDNVKKYSIPVDDIVAIFTNRKGTYEDVIVATGGIDKYLTNKPISQRKSNIKKQEIATKGKELGMSDKDIAYKQTEVEQLERNKVTKDTTMGEAISSGNVEPTKNGSYKKVNNEKATNQVISLITPSENKVTVKTQDVYNNDVTINKPSNSFLKDAKTNGEIIDKLESTKTTSQKAQDRNDALKMERTYARRKEKIDDDTRLTEYEKTEMDHMFKSLSLAELEQKWTDAIVEDIDNVIEQLNVEVLNKEITPDTIAKAAVLAKYYDQQGDFITADEYYQLASTALHDPARTLATAKLIYQDNPMGAYMALMRSIEDLYKHDAKYHKNDIKWHEKNDLFNSDGSINKNSPYRLSDEVKQDLGAKIREYYRIENMNSKEAKAKKMEIDTLLSDNLPEKPKVEKVMDFRRAAMLNSVGVWLKNSRQELIDLTVSVLTDIGSSPSDRYLEKIRNSIENEVRQEQGEETKQERHRTTSILTTSGKEYVDGYKDGIKNHWESVKNDVVLNRYSELTISNGDRVSAISDIKRKSNSKVQQFLNKANALGMGADERFREAYFATALYDQQAQFALNMAANQNKKAVARSELTAGGAKITFADPDTLTLQYELVPSIQTEEDLISYLDENYISPTEKDVNTMLDRASQIGNYRTMQDSGALTRFTNKMIKTIDDFTIEHIHVPLGSAIAPFYRASTESLRTLYKSSPLAAIEINKKIKAFEKAVRDNATGDNTTNNLFDMQYSLAKDIGQAIGGSMALAIGSALTLALKQKGAIVGNNPDDKKDEEEYTLKIGDKNYSFNIDTVTTNELKFLSILTDDKNISKKEGDSIIKNIERTISNFANPVLDMVLEQTALSSFAEYGESKYRSRADNIGYQLSRVPASFVPTLSKNIASIFDGFTARDTSSDTLFGKMVNAVGSKIPFVRSMYAEKKDKWNSTEEAGLNILDKAWNSLVNKEISSRKTTPIDQELYDVYLATGSTNAFPTTGLTNTFTRGKNENKATYTLTYDEQKKYQQTYGQKAFDTLSELIDTKVYKNANDKDKLTMIRAVYDYAKTYAQNEYLDTKDVYYEKEETVIEKVINQDISYTSAKYQKQNPERWKLYTSIIPDYDDYKEVAKNISDIEDTYSSANGFNYKTKRNKVVEYVNALNLSATKKAMLIKISGYQGSYGSYDKSIYNYINTLGLTEEEYNYFIKESNLGLTGYYTTIRRSK